MVLWKAPTSLQQKYGWNCCELKAGQIYSKSNYLYTGHSWRQHQASVVPVNHCHDTDRSGSQSPWVLIHVLLLLRVRVLNHNLKHLGEVLTQMMRGAPLNGTATGADVGLHCCGEDSTSKLLFLRLATSHDRNSQQVLIDLGIQLQDGMHLAAQGVTSA